MIALTERLQLIKLLQEATQAGARLDKACDVLGLSLRTFQRWQATETVVTDQRTLQRNMPRHALTLAERAEVLAVANSATYGHLPPTQIIPRLADEGRYLASESTFYRILRAMHLGGHRRSERPAQKRHKPNAGARPVLS